MNCDLIHSSMETACKVSSQVAPKMKYPDDWKAYTLNKLVEQTQYGTNQAVSTDGFIPIIGMKEIQNGKVLIAAQKVSLSPSEQEKYRLDDGDILLNRTNSLDLVGKSGVYHQNTHAVFASYLIRLKPVRSLIDSDYLGYYLNSYPAYITLKKIATAAISQANINPTELKRLMVIPCPSLPEQRRIAEFLGTWDEAIEKLEQLIAAEEAVLNAYLSRFVSAYESQNIPLGKLDGVKIEKGRSVTKSLLTGGDIPVIAGGKTTPYYCSAYTHDGETVTISASGAYAGYVWYHSGKIWASDCNVLTSSAINVKFIFFALKYQQQRIYSLQSGGAQPHVYAKDIEKILIPMLPRDKQDEIVKILSLFEQKALLHRQELAALQKQKRGLMQKLLTGTWRI